MPRATKADKVFGEIALKNKLLTKSQVEECVKALEKSERGAKTLGEVVEKRGLLSARAVTSISRAINFREARLDGKLYARIAVKSKFAEVKEVRHALEAQKKAYLRGEPTPEVGELLVGSGAVTTDEDKAIRKTMADLDKEALIGKAGSSGDDGEDGDGLGDGLEDAADVAPKDDARASKPSGRLAKKTSGRGAKQDSGRGGAAAGKPGGGSGRSKERPAVMVDDEILKESEEDGPGSAGAEGAAGDGGKALDGDGIAFDEVDHEISARAAGAEAASAAARTGDVDSSSSSISDSSSGRTEPAPIEELVADLNAHDAKPRPPGASETHDVMDVVMAPGDLAPLLDAPPEDGATKPATASAPKRPESGEKGSVIEVPKLAAAEGEASECPRCNVRIEPNVMECLYCGYKVPGGASESAREAAAPPAAAAVAKAPSGRAGKGPAAPKPDSAPPPAKPEAAPKALGGDLGKALAGELSDVKSIASGIRFEVLRAKDVKRGGAPCVALALPAGSEPTAEQVAAFEADAAAAKKLSLRQLLNLERIAKAGGRTVLVYEDAPGAPASERVKSGPLDRLKASRATRELAAALAEASKAGLSSRELRPEAIFIVEGDSPSPRVAGYAAARLTEAPAQGAVAEGGFDGFVPSERTKKADAANARTDLFGVGAFLKLLLSGNAPSGKEPKADLPDAPGGLKTVLVKTLDPASGKRFLDFSKLLEELEKAPGVKGTTVELKR